VNDEPKGRIHEVLPKGDVYLLGIYTRRRNKIAQLSSNTANVEQTDHKGNRQAGFWREKDASQYSVKDVGETDEGVETAEVVNYDGQDGKSAMIWVQIFR
jgi:hypothetical protein